MSEHKQTVPDASPCKFADLQTKSNQELLAEVDAIMEQDAAHMDVERLEACLDLLQERAPVAQSYDPEASWREFTDRHALILERAGEDAKGGERAGHTDNRITQKQRKQQTKIGRRVLVIAAIIVLMLGIMITVQATGKDVFGSFARWTEETFHFTSFSAAALEPAAEPARAEVDFEELVSEFEELGVPRDLVLTWVPEGYVQGCELEKKDLGYMLKYKICFVTSTGAEIQFFVQQHLDSPFIDNIIFEKNGVKVERYVSLGRLFYLYSNTDNTSYFAVWSSEEYIVELCSDDLSSSDLKRIIDSIGAEL